VSVKTDQKKDLILKKAAEVFAKKGFKDVTMKDIVEACEISRGGLYLYYDNTRDIFADVLKRAKKAGENEESDFYTAVREHADASDLLALYLQEQKNEIFKGEGNLGIAAYEYFFSDYMTSKRSDHKSSVKNELSIIEGLLKRGNDEGDLYVADPKAEALNMTVMLEGMKILSRTGAITEKEVSDEILYLLGGVLSD